MLGLAGNGAVVAALLAGLGQRRERRGWRVPGRARDDGEIDGAGVCVGDGAGCSE